MLDLTKLFAKCGTYVNRPLPAGFIGRSTDGNAADMYSFKFTLVKMDDFISVFINLSNKQLIQESFEEIDEDQDGLISAEDLSKHLSAPTEKIEELMARVFDKRTLDKDDVFQLVTAN